MANIQASLNNMLSAAQTGAFIYSQTPAYKEQAAKKEELRDIEKRKVISDKFAEDDVVGFMGQEEFAKYYEAGLRDEIRRAEIDPSFENIEKAKEAYSDIDEFRKMNEETKKYLREKEEKELAALNEKIETQRRQQASMKWREDFLRAGRDTIPTNYSTKEDK